MKIAVLGDAHVGRSVYPVASQGVNVRERDFERSFVAAVDLMIDQNPDLILFLGDIFDFPRPSFRSFRLVQKVFFNIHKSGIPLIAISGNHDTPRLGGTESPYAALHDVFPDFGLIYRQQYEYVDLGDVRIHGIPQMMSEAETVDALEEASRNKSFERINLVITHPRVRQLAPSYADINEINLDAESIGGDFALLGHYHFHARVRDNMWYVGSTDTFSFADNPELDKGIAIFDTARGEFTHIALDGRRPLFDLGMKRVIGLGSNEIEQIITDEVEKMPQGSVVRLRLDGVDPGAYRLIDQSKIKDVSRHLLFFKIEPSYLSSALEVDLPALDSIPAKWERFVDQQDIEQNIVSQVKALGSNYIVKAIESS